MSNGIFNLLHSIALSDKDREIGEYLLFRVSHHGELIEMEALEARRLLERYGIDAG